ncbi:MAG: asparagine--tRNA ligase [Erysipelotrichaceae bacterium]|nr:asparagine--tRNA ligase [Erysipelotrichaceae bacterium]
MVEFKTIRELYEAVNYGDQLMLDSIDEVELEGWIRTNRDNGSIGFIELNDGTYFKNIQLVYNNELPNHDEVSHYLSGAAINVKGKFILTPNGKQPFEIQVTSVELEGDVDPSYPLQKKRHSFEYLREIAHLRPRTNTFNAVFRLRSVLSMAIHEFFQNQGFVYVHTPLLTGISCEGDDMFRVVTGDKDPDAYFCKKCLLSGSGQIHVEAYAMAFRDVYTFGPTFRSEKSNTRSHASEFWMIEPEIAFADLEDDMSLIEDCVTYCIEYCLENAPEEMKFFNDRIDRTLLERLNHVLNTPFRRMEYTEAINILKEAIKNGHPFQEKKIEWGMDLQSEHERYISEVVVKGPVFLINYPKEIKSFYMRENDDGKTVAACDLLVPGVGELVGGSQREERYDILERKMKESGLPMEKYQWYLDLRRYGGCKHAGFGIGFERLMMYLTGIENIRDVEPFPRTYGSMDY